MKNIKSFLSENFQLLKVKFSIYLNRRDFVMEIDHDIFSTVILSLLLIQEGSCQFLVKEIAQVLIHCLED